MNRPERSPQHRECQELKSLRLPIEKIGSCHRHLRSGKPRPAGVQSSPIYHGSATQGGPAASPCGEAVHRGRLSQEPGQHRPPTSAGDGQCRLLVSGPVTSMQELQGEEGRVTERSEGLRGVEAFRPSRRLSAGGQALKAEIGFRESLGSQLRA